MAKLGFTYGCVCIATLLTCYDISSAQQGPIRSNSGAAETNKPSYRSAEFDPIHKQNLDFIVRVHGSVSGRIFEESVTNGPTQDAIGRGVAGVKITLRSRDVGFERFRLEQFTDLSGTYSFQDLPSGKYTIEIDPTRLRYD